MSHYTYDPNIKHTILVPILNIAISKPIRSAVQTIVEIEVDSIMEMLSKMQNDPHVPSFGSLQRLYNFSTFCKSTIPPIVASKIQDTEYYSITDGRHRVAMSIAAGFTEIPVKLKY